MYHVVIPYSLHIFPVFLFAQSVLVKLNLCHLTEYVMVSLISRSLGTLRNLFSSSCVFYLSKEVFPDSPQTTQMFLSVHLSTHCTLSAWLFVSPPDLPNSKIHEEIVSVSKFPDYINNSHLQDLQINVR